jgi:arylsulfatase A-like enzyme
MAEWILDERSSDSPLLLEVGFLGPHPPYDPPKRLLERYADIPLPVPQVTTQELDRQPPPHSAYREEMKRGNHDAVIWNDAPSDEQLLRLRRHYAANVTLIDEQIGRIMAALERNGYLENSIVVFMSDHGDCLGDHGHIQKWTMYDEITRMPMIVRAPTYLPTGKRVNALLQQMDIVPMLFELAGLSPPEGSAISALPCVLHDEPGREVVFAEHASDRVLKEVNFVTMARTREWKLVHYLDQPWGELYNLRDDPGELNNVWEDPSHEEIKNELMLRILDWRLRDSLTRVKQEDGGVDLLAHYR